MAPRLRLLVPDPIRPGVPIRLVLRLENAGDRPRTIHLQGRPPAFDLTVNRRGGGPVWRRLRGRVVSAILGIRELPPGGAIELEDHWNQLGDDGTPAGPGDYVAVGTLPTEPGRQLVTAPVAFTIPSR